MRTWEQPDDFRIPRVLHIDHVRGVIDLAAIGFERLVRGDHDVLKPRVSRVGNDRIAGVKRDGADGVELILHFAEGLGLGDVAQIHDVHAEGAEASVADIPAVLDAPGDLSLIHI